MKTQEFKKQIGKYLGAKIREFGFKGSGFDYVMDSDRFVFVIGLQGNKYGGSFCVELGVHPKEITNNGLEDLNFGKLKYYDCEFRTRLTKEGKTDKWWKFTDSESKNLKVIDEVILFLNKYGMPVINGFKKEPELLENVKISDLKKNHIPIPGYKSGLKVITTDIRLAWALAMAVENSNPKKAVEFAKYALANDQSGDTFFGVTELNRIIDTYDDITATDYSKPERKANKNLGFWVKLINSFKKR